MTVSAPIIDLESAHYEYAVYFDKLGYDIYDKNSSFYNDICISVYYKENDITIEDRKKEIFPNNMTIVNPNCVYKMADLKNKRLICEYNIAEVFESRKTKAKNPKTFS